MSLTISRDEAITFFALLGRQGFVPRSLGQRPPWGSEATLPSHGLQEMLRKLLCVLHLRPCSYRAKQTKIPAVVKEAAIGIFDSGVGGLTVLQQIARLLPRELLVYLGDTARYPYGSKSAAVVTQYACENTDFLMERGLKMLVVACNTASAVALPTLRERYAVPVIGVIEPGAQAALRYSKNGRIGVIGTQATIASGAYTQALRMLDPAVEVYTRACPLFVPLVEEGWVDNEVARATVALYLSSLKHSGVDTLILGCTHYPLLKKAIAAFLGSDVCLVDSAEQTAQVVRETLLKSGLARRKGTGRASFFVTDEPDRFVKVGARFLGQQVESAVRVESRLWSPPAEVRRVGA